MRKLDDLSRLLLTILALFQDVLRFFGSSLRARSAVLAENLFLRKQLALYLERKVKPRHADDAARLTLLLRCRLFAWENALTIVKPDTRTFCRTKQGGSDADLVLRLGLLVKYDCSKHFACLAL